MIEKDDLSLHSNSTTPFSQHVQYYTSLGLSAPIDCFSSRMADWDVMSVAKGVPEDCLSGMIDPPASPCKVGTNVKSKSRKE